jgi:pyruvate dehydrogenase E1 component beta subunit
MTSTNTMTSTSTTRVTFREAFRAGLRQALLDDERVVLLGEDVGAYGGCYAVSKGLLAEFGPERVRDTPLSELAFVGIGIGAAMGGLKPIVEVMTVNFSLLALDQIVNNAATLRHMSGGQITIPLVLRIATGAGRQVAAQHSHSFENIYAHIPGLRVLTPGTLEDARGMLAAALEENNPVLIFEHAMSYALEGELSGASGRVEIDHARVRRPGRDVSLITYGGSVHKTLGAAEELARLGIDAEVVDLRTLRPLDDETIMASVRRTRRAVLVDEGWRTLSVAAEVSARIMEQAFYDLDAPVQRVCSEEVPMPYPKHLEDAALPSPERIVRAVRELMGGARV